MPATGSSLKFVTSGAAASTPTPSKHGSPSTNSMMASPTTPTPLENIASPHELTTFVKHRVETVLMELENKFDDMSSQVLDRLTQMSSRIDSLELSIHELLNGDLGSTAPASPAPGSSTRF
ncbi:hypothetical protein K439DRAFT_1657726 [Ramaria rubella]|nr:hypothetical protein K439DRAFT_1657726 [Ramaria rubella]